MVFCNQAPKFLFFIFDFPAIIYRPAEKQGDIIIIAITTNQEADDDQVEASDHLNVTTQLEEYQV